MKNWLKYFSLNQIIILDGETLKNNPAKEVIKVQEQIGLPVEINQNNFYKNRTTGFYCFKKNVHTEHHCLGYNKGRTRGLSGVEGKTLKKLEDFYSQFNEKFFEIVNKRFVW